MHTHSPFRVLIIDDEQDICFLLGNMLKQKKFEVDMAHTLFDGMNTLRKISPQILFLDINLPDGSGLDAIRNVKRDFPKTKVVMMSAYDGAKERDKARTEGADVFISKPLSYAAIMDALKNVNE